MGWGGNNGTTVMAGVLANKLCGSSSEYTFLYQIDMFVLFPYLKLRI